MSDSVWMVGSKTFMLLFATEDDANRWQHEAGMFTPASYIMPVEVPVISYLHELSPPDEPFEEPFDYEAEVDEPFEEPFDYEAEVEDANRRAAGW